VRCAHTNIRAHPCRLSRLASKVHHDSWLFSRTETISHWHHRQNPCALGETLRENDLNDNHYLLVGCLVLYQHQPQGYQVNYFICNTHQGRDSAWLVGRGLAESRIGNRRTSESYNQVPVLGHASSGYSLPRTSQSRRMRGDEMNRNEAMHVGRARSSRFGAGPGSRSHGWLGFTAGKCRVCL